MKLIKLFFGVLLFAAIFIGVNLSCHRKKEAIAMFDVIKVRSDIPKLFPKTVAELQQQVKQAKDKADAALTEIIAIPDQERTFENTVKKLDDVQATSDLSIMASITEALKLISPDDALRQAASDALVDIKGFYVDHIANNVKIYNALKAYDQGAGTTEPLNAEQRYFLTEILKDFKRSGLDLPEAERTEIVRLKKEIAEICSQFETHIASDNRTITVSLDGLDGLDQDFIDTLQKNEKGEYILGIDYPTLSKIMTMCTVEDTRKRLQFESTNRGYPANEPLLKKLIAKRDELAHRLGFESYAALNLDDSMVKNVETAQLFLNELMSRSSKKEQEEFNTITSDMPDSITLTRDRKLPTWNVQFVEESYKKKHYAIDEDEISHYFPMENTIAGLLDIYRQFLSVEFVEAPISNLWHEDVRLIEVFDKDKQHLLGYLLLDLYPRPNKYSHACELGIVPVVKDPFGNDRPGLALVVCNFTKSTATKPSLLNRNFVSTFFHEFGHALHQLLGRTQMASLSGTSVKTDFVEMPSQMLEEWLWDKDILKNLSRNYLTKQPLPDDMINKMIELKNFDSGYFVLRQAYLSQLCLDYYKDGADKDVNEIQQSLYNRILKNYQPVHGAHSYASFGHLTSYGAQYYGYMWSKVYALDLFYEIKKHGLLNPAIGARYVQEILAPGGSKNPNELLQNFLGRAPSQEAFFKDLGL